MREINSYLNLNNFCEFYSYQQILPSIISYYSEKETKVLDQQHNQVQDLHLINRIHIQC